MKKSYSHTFFLIIVFQFFLNTGYAQKLDFSNPEKSFKRIYSKIIGQNANGFFVVRSLNPFNSKTNQLRFRDNRIELSFIENNMANKWTFAVELPGDAPEIQDILFMKDSMYVFYSQVKKEANINELFAYQVNIHTGGYTGQPKKIDEIAFDKKKNKGIFYIGVSKDENYFFSMYKQPNPDNEKLGFNLKVFDSFFKEVWQRKYQTNFYEGILLLNEYVIDNHANVYLLTSFETERKVNSDRKFSVSKASRDSSDLLISPVSLDKSYINDLKLSIDYVNNKLVLAGFYSEVNSFSSAGIAYITMDMTTNEMKKYVQSFKAKFLNEFSGERTVNRGTELINYYVDKVILRSDGGAIVIAESNYITESTNYNSYYQLYTTSYTYHYDNVLIFSVNTSGKIEWENIIRKNQVSEDDGAFYSSYILSVDKDKLHFIYNKFVKRSSDILRHTLNNKGESIEKVMLKESDNVLIMPNGGKQIGIDKMVIPCLQKNKTNFMRISF
jgi:hypothetical protein